jgi:hypothetical protein
LLNAVTVTGKSWRAPPTPTGSAAVAVPLPTSAGPQAALAASVVVLASWDCEQPGTAFGSNLTSFLSKSITARLAFGGIAAGFAASAVVVSTKISVALNFFLSNFGFSLPPS